MIRVVVRGAVLCPTFICDLCDGEIADARWGGYWWRMGEDGPCREPIVVLHKRGCAATWERTNGGRAAWYWDELSLLPIFVAANSGLTPRDLVERARSRADV